MGSSRCLPRWSIPRRTTRSSPPTEPYSGAWIGGWRKLRGPGQNRCSESCGPTTPLLSPPRSWRQSGVRVRHHDPYRDPRELATIPELHDGRIRQRKKGKPKPTRQGEGASTRQSWSLEEKGGAEAKDQAETSAVPGGRLGNAKGSPLPVRE